MLFEALPTAGDNLPQRLVNELKTLPDLEWLCCTEVVDGKSLRTGTDTMDVSVIMQAYVFFDKEKGQEARTSLPLAVYLPDSEFSYITVVDQKDNRSFLAVNPTHISDDRCSTEVSLDAGSQCSSDNAKVRICTLMPTVVFYTLCLVPFHGKIVKAAVTRHVLILEDCHVSSHVLSMIKKELHPGYTEDPFLNEMYQTTINNDTSYDSTDAFVLVLTNFFRADPDPSGAAGLKPKLLDFFHGIVWKESGCPQASEYGREELSAHEHKAKDPSGQESALHRLWIKRMTHAAVMEVVLWLQSI
jgi:hypothetical protein